MTVEDLYIENIDEFVKDEDKIVTYKWLSQTLQVHCNTAKQMLYKYIDTERNVKQSDCLNVTYFVSGLTKPDDSGEQMFKCTVVPEEKLEACKSTLAILTSCHVYSVQKTKLKDSNALYMTDYAKFKENVFDCNKYSSIQYGRATLRSVDELHLLSVNYTSSEPEKKPATASNGSTASKPSGKKQPQSAIASMFAKSDANKKDNKTDVKPQVKEEPKTSAKDKGGSKGGMKAFFSKQTDKKVQETSSEKNKSPVKTETKSKKTARQDDSDDEEIVRSKRRRTQDLFDSGSEEEMEEEPDSPIPPTPPPTPAITETNVKTEPEEMEETEDPILEKTSKSEEPSKGENSGKRRRVKRRKQVNKTYMDKDGFMVTEKVFEEESTDASEAEEPPQKVTKKTGPTKSPPPKGKKSPKKASPSKKGQGSGKQTSLMSFFKKS